MAKSYRISIPIDAETREAFQRMADVMGKSLGSTIGDWVSETKDAAELVTIGMKRAKDGPSRVMRLLQDVHFDLDTIKGGSSSERGGDPACGEAPGSLKPIAKLFQSETGR